MKVEVGGRLWDSMAQAKRAADILLDEHSFIDGDELTCFPLRLVRDLLDYHNSAEWFLSHGEVGRITTETQNNHRVFAAYVGPESERFYFGTTNIRWNPKTEYRKLSDTARSKVGDQMVDFRRTTPRPMHCPICDLSIQPDDILHVDHIDPFCRLLAAFRATHRDPTDQVQPDDAWVSAWQAYHKEHAVLRGIRATCNLNGGCPSA
jgi:hypothetical protein